MCVVLLYVFVGVFFHLARCDTESVHKQDIALRPRHESPVVSARTPSKLVLVRGINQTTEETVLRLFFQNNKRSGGGPVDSIDYTRFKHEATITFCNIEGTVCIK